MSTTASPTAAPKPRPSSSASAVRPPATSPRSGRSPAPNLAPRPRGARTLFTVPFTSAMNDQDAAVLSRTLDLATHLHPKLHNSPASPGVLRLDFDSGLFLQHGPREGDWVLQGRTWGHPAPSTVREWHVNAAMAAHQLDPAVTVPLYTASTPSTVRSPGRPHIRAEDHLLARIARHIHGRS